MRTNSIRSLRAREKGVVLIFAMVALVIVLVGAAAIVRSMNASLSTSGNYGFKRDLGNQGERAVDAVINRFKASGALGTEVAREENSPANNYKAVQLETNPQGIPLSLLPGGDFASVASEANDINVTDMGVKVRYVIDRLCVNTGSLGSNSCVWASAPSPKGGGDRKLGGAADGADVVITPAKPGTTIRSAVKRRAVYRLTVHVTGPRNTQAYYQSTFTD
jgi:type IV pilus assembly protein PilX